jgi:hypothetical protein
VRACLQYEAFFSRLGDAFAACDVGGTGHAHPPLLELVRRAVSPAPDTGAAAAAAAAAAAPQDDARRWAEMGGEESASPPRPDLSSLERDAQLAFAALRLRTLWEKVGPGRGR